MRRKLTTAIEQWPLAQPFTISRGTITEVAVVVVTIEENGCIGRGECRPYPRYNETTEGVVATIDALRLPIEQGADRSTLQSVMAAGAGRNALDCALWDLEAKLTGNPVYQIAGLEPPKECLATYTIGLDAPDRMAFEAKRVDRPLLKLKLGAPGDDERIRAVRQAVPRSRLVVDANEGWAVEQLEDLLALSDEHGIELVEQPLPAGADQVLKEIQSPVPLCADESCHTSADLSGLPGAYQFVSIKLDKAGGLTEAMVLAEQARAQGFGQFLSCMMATSLAMAPAAHLANNADYVDLDAPLLLARDRDPPIEFVGATMQPPNRQLWG